MAVSCLAFMGFLLGVSHTLYISAFPVVRSSIKSSWYLGPKGEQNNNNKKMLQRTLGIPLVRNMRSSKAWLSHTEMPKALKNNLPEDTGSDTEQAGPVNLESDLEFLISVPLIQNENSLFSLIYRIG